MVILLYVFILLQLYYTISLTTVLLVGDLFVVQIFVPNIKTIHHNDSSLISFSMRLDNER